MPQHGLGCLGGGGESTGTERKPLRGQERWGDAGGMKMIGRASPLVFAQSGSSAGKGGFSNDWKKFPMGGIIRPGGAGVGKGLREVFGKQMEQRGQQIRGRIWEGSQYDWFRQWGLH